MKNQQKIVTICGPKNCGKTTLIEALIPKLNALGCMVAVIKHHGHRFEPDMPGTDTWRFFRAGALGAVISDDHCFMLSKRLETTAADLASLFPEADLLLLEGYHDSTYPKIEISADAFPNPDTVLETLVRLMRDGR